MRPFIADMASELAAADLVICRAGAITVSELCAAGVASVLVPLVVSTTAHQRDNAEYMARGSAAIHLPQSEAHARATGRVARNDDPPQVPAAGAGSPIAGSPERKPLRAWPIENPDEPAPSLAFARHPPGGRVSVEMKHAVKRIHFVGIGGAGMSGIAEILHNLGFQVSGSDQSDSAVTQRLALLGVQVRIGHAAEHIGKAQALVTSTAVKADNPEVLAARVQGHPGGAARRDAGRVDAAEERHRHRRHARQDDHDLAGHQHPRGVVAATRPSSSAACSMRRAPTRGSARASSSSSRPTRAMPPS